MKLANVLKNKRIVITVGAGGVGKTTLAASIGLWLAMTGKRVMVVTIDPAHRLANALGLDGIGSRPHRVDLSGLNMRTRGDLTIMMLESGAVFRDLIGRTFSNPDQRERILNNKFFQRFTEAMAGTQEHAAIEKLHELSESGVYDVIVLDTPPSQHALDFLNAPDRLLDVLDDAVVRWLVKPASSGLSMVSFGGKYTSKILALFTGTEFFVDLTEFLSLMSGDLAGFRERTLRVRRLLHQDDTVYIGVASPERHAMEGAIMFSRTLTEQNYGFSAFIMNRIWQVPDQPLTRDLLQRQLKRSWPGMSFPSGFAHRAYLSYIHRVNVARIHRLKTDQLIASTSLGYPVFQVPSISREIENLAGISFLAGQLFGCTDLRQQFVARRQAEP